MLSTGCALARPLPPSSDSPPPAASATAFGPLQATATPAVVRLWTDPALPLGLQTSVARLEAVDGLPVVPAESAEASDLQARVGGAVEVSRWVYALVAPFASLQEGLTLSELQARWSGAPEDTAPIFVRAEDLKPLEAILGSPGESVLVVNEEELVDQTWTARPALAVLPFEALEPRWKVLAVDGMTPLDPALDPTAYPLSVSLGVSGPAESAAALAQALASDWPASNRDPTRLTRLVMTGVTALTRATAWRMEGKGVTYPARDIGDWLRTGDITHISNEVSFAEDCPPANPGSDTLRFCSAPENIGLLEDIGTDVVELTGNHILDWGPAAFLNTLAMYRERGWDYFAGGQDLAEAVRPLRLEHNGNRLAFIGCNAPGPGYAQAKANAPGAAPCSDERVMEVVTEIRAEGYLPIFTYQWGESDRSSPLPLQEEAFRRAVDAGAVIVSGSQAHQPQGFEFYHGGFIHYGPGNLFFDQMDRIENREMFVDRHVFYDGRHISTELLTGLIEDYSRPRPMTAEERAGFLARMFGASGW
jgi:poly-gamma-glutamate synthesis protein (capsule biosynthesis protein)